MSMTDAEKRFGRALARLARVGGGENEVGWYDRAVGIALGLRIARLAPEYAMAVAQMELAIQTPEEIEEIDDEIRAFIASAPLEVWS